jgi:HSP20 family protein
MELASTSSYYPKGNTNLTLKQGKKMKNQIQRGFPNPVFRDEFFSPLDTLFDKVFSESFPELTKEIGINPFQQNAYPKCDIINFDDRIEIIAEVPGLTKEQITIDVDGDVITLKGEKSSKSTEKEGGTYLRREVKRSSFLRSFTADSKIFNLDNVKASFEDGVLELQIPKREPEQPKKRTITIG